MRGRTGDRKAGRIGEGRGMGGGREVGWRVEVKGKRAGTGNARYGRREFWTPLILLPPLSCDIDLREVLWAHETEQAPQTLVFTKTAEHKPCRRSMLLCHNLLRCWKISWLRWSSVRIYRNRASLKVTGAKHGKTFNDWKRDGRALQVCNRHAGRFGISTTHLITELVS